MLRRKLKRSTKQYIIVAVICTIVMGGAAAATAIIITGQIRDKYVSQLEDAYQEMKDNKRTVYVTTKAVSVGDMLTKDNVTLKTVYATQPQEVYMTSEDVGKVTMIDLTTGTQLLKGMLLDQGISSDLREIEYNVIQISSNIVVNDSVDIRITFPNGENYIVLSKKLLKNYTPETAACILWLREEELLLMSAAIVDAALYNGSSLSVTKYIEAGMQKESIVNYTPSLAILDLIERDPNIIERASQELNKMVRKALENRLANSLAADVTKVQWDVNPNLQTRDLSITTPMEGEEVVGLEGDVQDNNTKEVQKQEVISEDDYFYYAEEEEAKEEDIEYGE